MTAQSHSGTRPAIALIPSPRHAAIVMCLALIAPPLLSALLFKPPFVLPSMSLISLTLAGVIALPAWARANKQDQARITLWDLSGLYAFLGFAAAMLSDPEHVMELWSLPTSDDGAAR